MNNKPAEQVLFFLTPDMNNGSPDGQFYADFGPLAPVAGLNQSVVPFITLGQSTKSYIQATALSSNPLSTFTQHDVVVTPHGRAIDIIDNSNPSIGGPSSNPISLGGVDTNRTLGGNNPTSFAGASAGPIAVLDYNHDGVADFAVLTSAPAGFLVAIEGNGTGVGGTITSGTGDNAGYFFGSEGLNIGTTQVAIRAGDLTGDGFVDSVAVLDYDFKVLFGVVELKVLDPTDPAYNPQNPGATHITTTSSLFKGAQDATVVAFDVFTPSPALAPTVKLMAVSVPDTTANIQNIGLQGIELLIAKLGECLRQLHPGCGQLYRHHGWLVETGWWAAAAMEAVLAAHLP